MLHITYLTYFILQLSTKHGIKPKTGNPVFLYLVIKAQVKVQYKLLQQAHCQAYKGL